MLERLIELIAGLGGPGLVLIAAALTYSETAIGLDFVVPGEAGLVVVGAAANGEIGVVPVIAVAAVGATAGDLTSFALGRRYGRKVLQRWSITRRLLPGVEGAQRFIERHGGRAIFGARFVGALRAVVPFVAGMTRMSLGRFLLWNVAASIAWCTTVVLVGYHVGVPAARFVDRLGPWTYLAFAVIVAVVWWRKRRSGDGGDADQTSSPKASQSGFSHTNRSS